MPRRRSLLRSRALDPRDPRAPGLDQTLADLYAVPVKVLNQAVKRNGEWFPEDFMFQLTAEESERLRSQSVILDVTGRGQNRKYLCYAFTEQGVAMLSSVLRSERAVNVNIEIMRAFVRGVGYCVSDSPAPSGGVIAARHHRGDG